MSLFLALEYFEEITINEILKKALKNSNPSTLQDDEALAAVFEKK